MNIDFDEKKKTIKIWLTNADQGDADVMRQVDAICTESKANNTQTVIYRSGEKDLKEGTLDLLIFNKKRQAEQIQKEAKRPRIAPQHTR